jgi:hypothetical protein
LGQIHTESAKGLKIAVNGLKIAVNGLEVATNGPKTAAGQVQKMPENRVKPGGGGGGGHCLISLSLKSGGIAS